MSVQYDREIYPSFHIGRDLAPESHLLIRCIQKGLEIANPGFRKRHLLGVTLLQRRDVQLYNMRRYGDRVPHHYPDDIEKHMKTYFQAGTIAPPSLH